MNILMFENGKYAKIADFGLARHVNNNSKISIVGCIKYMAPEALHGSPVEYKSDVY